MTLTRSPTVPSSSSSHSPVKLKAKCSTLNSLSTGKLVAMKSNKNNASDSQMRHVNVDPNSSTEKPVTRSKKVFSWSEIVPSQYRYLDRQCRVYGQTIRKRTTETWSERRRNGPDRNQRYDLENIHDCVFEENLRVTRNTEFFEIRHYFSITQKLAFDQQDEIFGVRTIDWDQTPRMKRTLVHEQVITLSTDE